MILGALAETAAKKKHKQNPYTHRGYTILIAHFSQLEVIWVYFSSTFLNEIGLLLQLIIN